MSKSGALKVVNALLAVLIVTQIGSGYYGMSMGSAAFDFIHRGGAVVLMVVAVAHIYLNWNWVKMVFKR
jgi:hypothetical protein